jgi:GntR family transcriptional regulator
VSLQPASAPLPAYLQIEQALSAEIANLKPGDAIPTEHELCERFGVSRMTARAGVARLVEQGMLYRVRGRGTFVSRPRVHRQSGRLLSFSEDMRARGLTPSSRVLHVAQRTASPQARQQLELGPGARVVLIERARLGDDIPMALESALLIPECAAVLGTDLEHGSLHQALTELGRTPSSARGTIRPERATNNDAAALEIAPGTPLIAETRLVYDAEGAPIELTETRYSPTRYVFEVELRRAEHH